MLLQGLQRKSIHRLFWARQYQLKLKKRAADIQQELLEDEAIVEDLLHGLPPDDADHQVCSSSYHIQTWSAYSMHYDILFHNLLLYAFLRIFQNELL